MKKNEFIKIISWNINGLRSIQKKAALKWVNSETIHFLCLQETKLSNNKFNHAELFQKPFLYTVSNISSKKGFSGTSTYTNIYHSDIDFCKEIDLENDGRIIKHKFKDLIIFNIYFPNGKLDKNLHRPSCEIPRTVLLFPICKGAVCPLGGASTT